MPSTATNRLQGLTTSVAVKAPVKVAASTNLTLSGEQTIAGVACADGDRVLAYGQSVPSENGIYVVSTGQWSRAKDFDGALDVVNGTLVVSNNTANDGIYYRVTTADPIVIGTSNIEFEAIIGGLTQSIIAQLLYPQTDAEDSAGVVPTHYQYLAYPRISIDRYGAVGDGVTDDYPAFVKARNVANIVGGLVELGPKTYYFSQRAELNTSGTGIIGSGYASCIKGESAGTYIILLIQHGTFGALNGIVLRDFRIDGNDGGQLDAGLLACNNVVGGVIDNVWVENGTRVSGSSGVNGMSFSAGNPGGTGNRISVTNCKVRNTTKAGINWTSESVEAYFAGNKVWEIGGNGTAPGFQVNGGFNGKIIGNDVEDCEGPGIYLATDGSGRPPRNATVALNTVRNCGNASTTLGDGIHVTNSSGTNVGRIIIAGNQIYDCGNATGGGSAIFVQNDDNLVIEGNIGRNCYYDGVRIASCNHVTVTGGRYSGNNVAGVSYAGGIHVLGTCGHVTITGVTCSDDKSVKTQSYGLILESGAVLSNLTVESCDFAGNAVGEVLMLAGFKRGRMALSLYRDTSDGIAVPVLAMAMPDECAYVVTQRSIGTKSDGSDRAIYSRQGLFYRDAGGNATRQGATTTLGTDIESNGSWGGAAMEVSTTYAVAQVQGVGSTTVHWSTRLEIESIAA